MNRIPVLNLDLAEVSGKRTLQLVSAYPASSPQAQRMIKSSRGSGFIFSQGQLEPWDTKSVGQKNGLLTVGGPLGDSFNAFDSGKSLDRWSFEGERGWEFIRAFVSFWTTLHEKNALPVRFEPQRVCVWESNGTFSFVLLPESLSDSITLLEEEQLPWESVRHPDATGVDSWAFATASLTLEAACGKLPWSLEEVTEIRQEIRHIKPIVVVDSYLPYSNAETADVLSQALGARTRSTFVGQIRSWSEKTSWSDLQEAAKSDAAIVEKRTNWEKQREDSRNRTRFWKKRGTLVTVLATLVAVVACVISWVVWDQLKPFPNDGWTQDQVVRGYYDALENLDEQTIRQLAYPSFETGKVTRKDFDEVANLYVMKQVRTVYEKRSPIRPAQKWLSEGRPEIRSSELLYGLAALKIESQGADRYQVVFQKWLSSTQGEAHKVEIQGVLVTDNVALVKTNRGWKIGNLSRTLQPLP